MAERNLTVITLGGKGSSLSSSSVFAVANGLAQVRIDSSALDRLNSFSTPQLPSIKYQIFIPKHLTLEEARASLVVLLNKLILSGSGVRTKIPILISEKLNLCTQTLDFEEIDVTERELLVLENSSSTLHGICALLDYQTSALSAVADVVAALSCEALGANIWALKVVDSGDGFTIKDQIGVASDLDDLLLGSKLVGKVECDSVSQIPKINGALREVAKSVHSKTRVELNSAVGKDGHVCGGTGEAVATSVLPLVLALLNLGKNSLCRAKMILDSISKDDLRLMFDKKCPSLESLRNRKFLEAIYVDYLMFLHEANGLLAEVREAVVWEAVTAFVAIDLIDKGGNIETSGGNEKVEKKSEKKNKKKAVLGKGTATIVQLIKDRLQDDAGDTGNCLSLLEKRVEGLYAIFDPKDPDFASLGNKVKEIVESNESRRIPKVPKGTRDFSKEQMAIREGVFSTVTEVYKRHGAMALDTPVFELRETLMGKYGEDSKLIFDLADQGGELYSLRYDLTVPFARYMGMNGLTSFKRYQIAKVYRRDNPSKGRYREFYQCDFDIAGFYERMGPDFEVIKILTELLDELAIGDYEVKLNHRMLLDGMLEICGVPPEKFRTISSSIDKLDKQSFEQIKKEMVEEKGLTVETADKIGTFVKLRGSPLELLSKLKQNGSEFLENSSSLVALDDLEILFKALEKSKCIDKVVFDMSLARGLDYYTGVIFEAVFKGATQVGSIAAGGRYDNLIGSFGTKQVPAVGVSLGIERVFTIMEQIQKEQKRTIRATETQVLVSIVGDKDKDLPKAADIVGDLWKAKLKAEFMVDKRVKKLIDRALDVKIPFMVIQGERELNAGVVKLKDMEAAKEEEVPRESLVEELQRRLGK